MIQDHILSELTSDEIKKLDFRAMGNLVLKRTISLSQAVNDELLDPLSQWLDDPNFMEKFAILIDSDIPWAKYKRHSRQWTKQQKHLTRERLKLYWQAIHRKRHYRKKLAEILKPTLINKGTKPVKTPISTEFISNLLAPFSPIERYRAKTVAEFKQAMNTPFSSLLPWRLILFTELIEMDMPSTTFNAIKQYIPDPKSDKIAKFQHLLLMDMKGDLSLIQNKPFGEIIIKLHSKTGDFEISIKDSHGQSHEINWRSITEGQRDNIINNAIERKILCRSVD